MNAVNGWLSGRQADMCADLAALIRHPSKLAPAAPGAPFGPATAACLDTALELGRRLGLRTGNMDGYVGWCEWGDGPELVAVLAHLDVVPEGDGWTVPPYEGLLQGGRVYGRGAIDDKGPAVAALYALAALKHAGIQLPRRVRLLLGTNEESGSADMRYYRDNGGELPAFGFTPDSTYPVVNGEKSIVNLTFQAPLPGDGPVGILSLQAGEAPNIVPAFAAAELACSADTAQALCGTAHQNVIVTQTAQGVRVEAHGTAAHGAAPWKGDNAAGHLVRFLASLPLAKNHTQPLRFLAERLGTQWDGSGLGIACGDGPSGPLTCNLGVLTWNDGVLQVKLNLRCPVTAAGQPLIDTVTAAFAAAGFTCVEKAHRPGFYLPPEHPLIAALCRVYTRNTGLPAIPRCIGGGTYAKALPNTVAFGPTFPGDTVREHQPDEFIEADRLVQNAQIIADAIQELAALPGL